MYGLQRLYLSYNEQAYTTGPSTLRIVFINFPHHLYRVVRRVLADCHTFAILYQRIRFLKTGSSHGYTYYVHQPNHDKTVTEKRKSEFKNSFNQLVFSLQCMLRSCNWVSFQCFDMRRLQGHFIILHLSLVCDLIS